MAPGARLKDPGWGPEAKVRLPVPLWVSTEGVIPFTASEPTFRTAMVAVTDCPTVLTWGRISSEARRGALLRRAAFVPETWASRGPSFPEATVAPPTGIARRTVEESTGAFETLMDTKNRAPVAPRAAVSPIARQRLTCHAMAPRSLSSPDPGVNWPSPPSRQRRTSARSPLPAVPRLIRSRPFRTSLWYPFRGRMKSKTSAGPSFLPSVTAGLGSTEICAAIMPSTLARAPESSGRPATTRVESSKKT